MGSDWRVAHSLRGHPLSLRIRGLEMLIFWKILRTYLMDDLLYQLIETEVFFYHKLEFEFILFLIFDDSIQ